MRSVLCAVVLLAGCTGSEPEPSTLDPDACERVRDHAIELRLAAAGGDPAELEKHRAALAAAVPVDVGCADALTPEQLDCQLAATDLDAYTACIPEVTP